MFVDGFEKNWSPIGPAGQHEPDMYLFATYVEPHEIVQCHMGTGKCDVIASTSIKHMVSALLEKHNRTGVHLATNAIRLSNGQYGALMHLVRHPLMYTVVAYVFSATHPYAITRVGREAIQLPYPNSVRGSILYSVGLMYVDGRVVVSYSIDDAIGAYLVTDESHLFSNMVEVPDESGCVIHTYVLLISVELHRKYQLNLYFFGDEINKKKLTSAILITLLL